MEPTETRYRGYILVTNDLGTDIWHGRDHVDTTYGPSSLKKARTLIDGWMEAK